MPKKCSKADFEAGRCVVPEENGVSTSTLILITFTSTLIGIIVSAFLVPPVNEFLLSTFPSIFENNLLMFVFGLLFLVISIFIILTIRRVSRG